MDYHDQEGSNKRMINKKKYYTDDSVNSFSVKPMFSPGYNGADSKSSND